jgi:hypothetical protein
MSIDNIKIGVFVELAEDELKFLEENKVMVQSIIKHFIQDMNKKRREEEFEEMCEEIEPKTKSRECEDENEMQLVKHELWHLVEDIRKIEKKVDFLCEISYKIQKKLL